jgi:hypothetical protein
MTIVAILYALLFLTVVLDCLATAGQTLNGGAK